MTPSNPTPTPTPNPNETAPCPCGSSQTLGACCSRWHLGPQHLQAPTAEALMRSRYSAFVLDRRDYLLATWHPSTRPIQLEPPEPGLRWLGLEVRCCRPGANPNHATVEFVARSKLGGRAQRLHEVSRFLRESGQWYYLDGQH